MSRKKVTMITGIILVIVIALGSGYYFKSNKEEPRKKNPLIEAFNNNKVEVDFQGRTLNPLVSVINKDKEAKINIKIDTEVMPNDVYIINPENSQITHMEKKDKEFVMQTKLEKDIDYGVIIDGHLAGGIKAVDDTKKADLESIKNQMLERMQCGIAN